MASHFFIVPLHKSIHHTYFTMELSDQEILLLEVLIAPLILLAITQVCQFRGWCKVCRFYTTTELKVMFRPIQNFSKKGAVLEHGEAMIGTKPLIEFRNDMIDCMNISRGGLLAVCAPFGHGKTTTVLGAALGRLDGMPQRALFLSPGPGPGWYTRVKQLAGLRVGLGGFDGAKHLLNAVGNEKVTTKLSKRLRFLDVAHVQSKSLQLFNNVDYGVLVIEDYCPEELLDKDTESVHELKGLLKDREAFTFLCMLGQNAYQGNVVVVITTTCKNTLRLIHHGINGGQKAIAAPFTTVHDRKVASSLVEIPQDHCGISWDQQSRRELFSKKYAPFSETQPGSVMVDRCSTSNLTIRDCCQEFYRETNRSCAKLKPTWSDYATDYIMDPLQRLVCCQPACSIASNCIDDDDNNMELGESTARYGTMS